jgi:hypothetical protein
VPYLGFAQEPHPLTVQQSVPTSVQQHQLP